MTVTWLLVAGACWISGPCDARVLSAHQDRAACFDAVRAIPYGQRASPGEVFDCAPARVALGTPASPAAPVLPTRKPDPTR